MRLSEIRVCLVLLVTMPPWWVVELQIFASLVSLVSSPPFACGGIFTARYCVSATEFNLDNQQGLSRLNS